jgi:hypothetical protein
MDEKSSPFVAQVGVVIHKPQNGSGGIKGIMFARALV